MDAFRLGGKVALVTGASRGLGAAMACALASAGADVALHSNEHPAHETAARIGKGPTAGPRYEVTRFEARERAEAVRDSLLPMTGRSRKELAGFEGILVVSDSTVTTAMASGRPSR